MMYSEEFVEQVAQVWSENHYGDYFEAYQEPPNVIEGTDYETVHLSLDLSEATYNLPFEVIELQNGLLNSILGGFSPWRVFRRLFELNARTVQLHDLIDQGYWEGPDTVLSENGTFMGDPLSFIHLSMYLRSTVYSTCGRYYRPIGQSVGDDLILLGITPEKADKFNQHILKTGGKTSKFNASSKHAITFCENFAYQPADWDSLYDYPSSSKFGDLVFLDIIKGSILSGKTKVKTTGSDPFFGHSKMLNKQLDYHPIKWIKQRAGRLLYVANYNAATKLNGSMASLPEALGGIDLSIGTKVDWEDKNFQEYYLPYFEGILRLPDRHFFLFATLLRGIYSANPKGVPYSSDFERLENLFKDGGGLFTHRVRSVNSFLPVWMERLPIMERLRFVGKELRLAPLSNLIEELARREAYLKFWEEEDQPPPFMTLPMKSVRKRHHQTWGEIRKSISPVPKDRWKTNSITSLKSAFENRLWNVFYHKDDYSISEVFGKMPSLYIKYVIIR